MNVLIVDDDRFVVAALVKGLPWDSLGFTNIYTAYNITEAKAIINKNAVDLLLCDIDMPHGTGLDLLTWIRDLHNNMPAIFLTNYANFDYAQKALALKSFHYFLKPIEYDKLTSIIKDATLELITQNTQTIQNCEYFWFTYSHEKVADSPDSLKQYLQQRQLPYSIEDIFLPVIFEFFPYYMTSDHQLKYCFSDDDEQIRYVKTTFEAAFGNLLEPNDVFIEYNKNSSHYLGVFHLQSMQIPPLLLMNCESFIDLVTKQINGVLNCFVGIPSYLPDFGAHFISLRSMMENNLDRKSQVLLLEEYRPSNVDFPAPDTAMLELFLNSGHYNDFIDYCSQYLGKLSKERALNSHSLTDFQVDISQIIYSFLKSKGILVNNLLHSDSYHILSSHAKDSIYHMELYMQYVIAMMQKGLETLDSEKSIAESMVEYVNQHYAEDISRNDLTDIFYLDPDYASKLFKKETGMSFKNYIIQKRIEIAKDLLRNTNLPINTIADNVGYGNYSYFTRIFKKTTNMTPIEYRDKI